MLFPLEAVLADLTKEMRRTRLRVRGSVAIKQSLQVIQILRLVATRGTLRLFDCQINSTTRRFQRRKRSGVQLIGELVSQRVVRDRIHARMP